MPPDQIKLRSIPRGFLWVLLILKVLLNWFFYLLLFFLLLAWLGGIHFLILGVICLVLAMLSSFLIIYDHPLGWTKREVAFDFKEKQILLLNGFDHKALPDILDDKEHLSIPFSHIERLSMHPYESKFLRTIYRISVVTAGGKTKLLAIKSPAHYIMLRDQFKAAKVKVNDIKT